MRLYYNFSLKTDTTRPKNFDICYCQIYKKSISFMVQLYHLHDNEAATVNSALLQGKVEV